MKDISLPTPNEYAEFYAGYVQRAQASGDVFAALASQIDELRTTLGHLSDGQARFKPGPKEWSIKEVMGHLNDVERVFSYRLLRVSRNDPTPLPGFEQDDYVHESGFDEQPLQDLLQEFEYLRRANMMMVRHMSDKATLRIGTASGHPVSARALIYMLVGHVDHHLASLREVYFPGLNKISS